MLAAFTSAEQVANYALAGAIASGVGLPVTGFANAMFSRLTRSPRLRADLARRSLVHRPRNGPHHVGIDYLCCRDGVSRDLYTPMIALVVPLTLAQAVRGVTGIYNSFLSAHGRGRELRNAAIVLTVSNVILNFALIPPFRAEGAAWASLVALVANWIAHMVGYRQWLAHVSARGHPECHPTSVSQRPSRSAAISDTLTMLPVAWCRRGKCKAGALLRRGAVVLMTAASSVSGAG